MDDTVALDVLSGRFLCSADLIEAASCRRPFSRSRQVTRRPCAPNEPVQVAGAVVDEDVEIPAFDLQTLQGTCVPVRPRAERAVSFVTLRTTCGPTAGATITNRFGRIYSILHTYIAPSTRALSERLPNTSCIRLFPTARAILTGT